MRRSWPAVTAATTPVTTAVMSAVMTPVAWTPRLSRRQAGAPRRATRACGAVARPAPRARPALRPGRRSTGTRWSLFGRRREDSVSHRVRFDPHAPMIARRCPVGHEVSIESRRRHREMRFSGSFRSSDAVVTDKVEPRAPTTGSSTPRLGPSTTGSMTRCARASACGCRAHPATPAGCSSCARRSRTTSRNSHRDARYSAET